jgi:hypothetical protein
VHRHKGGKFFVRRTKWPGRLNVWGGGSALGFGEIYIFKENLNGELYCTTLEKALLSSAERLMNGRWWLLQDGDPNPASRLVTQCMSDHDIRTFSWPANLPDLNPIENTWTLLKDNVAKRGASSLEGLERYRREEWYGLSVTYAQRLVGSMPSRVREVIAANGDATVIRCTTVQQ